jgi:hypothetical protein
MKKAYELLEQYIEIAGVIFVVIDADHRVSLINRKGCDILGYKKEEILGKDWFSNFVPEKIRKKVVDTFDELLAGQRVLPEYFENPVITADGEERVVLWHNTVIKDEKGNITSSLSSGEDITERRKFEEELKNLKENLETEIMIKSKDLLEAKDRAAKAERLAVLGKLAGMVAHELRTPLGVIKHSVYFLKKNINALMSEDKVISHLDLIDSEVNISDKIIEDILTFARIKEPHLKACRVDDIIKKSFSKVPIPGNITLSMEISEHLPEIMADSGQITLVFSNIILNAVQAMPDGGALTIKAYADKDVLRVTITDTGMGILPENICKIFDALFTTKINGTGLGLPVCQNILEMHGGCIEVKSRKDAGTTFMVSLPVTRD